MLIQRSEGRRGRIFNSRRRPQCKNRKRKRGGNRNGRNEGGADEKVERHGNKQCRKDVNEENKRKRLDDNEWMLRKKRTMDIHRRSRNIGYRLCSNEKTMEVIKEVKEGDKTESDHVSLEVDLEIELEELQKGQIKMKDIIEREISVWTEERE